MLHALYLRAFQLADHRLGLGQRRLAVLLSMDRIEHRGHFFELSPRHDREYRIKTECRDGAKRLVRAKMLCVV
jgi:hypothetical protein